MPQALVVPWGLIEKFMIVGGSFMAAAKEFGVKEDTIRKRARRYKWPIPAVIEKRRLTPTVSQGTSVEARMNEAIAQVGAESWEQKGEKHRKAVFDLAHNSIKKMKPRAPKNFREA